jgi:hypothetical protein
MDLRVKKTYIYMLNQKKMRIFFDRDVEYVTKYKTKSFRGNQDNVILATTNLYPYAKV